MGEIGWIGWSAVAVGGALGSVSRVSVQVFLASVSLRFPWGTFCANVLGSFLIGFLAARWIALPAHSSWRLFCIAGFLGGFTTFSSFSLENLLLLRNERYLAFVAYLLGTLLVGLMATGLGYGLGRLGPLGQSLPP